MSAYVATRCAYVACMLGVGARACMLSVCYCGPFCLGRFVLFFFCVLLPLVSLSFCLSSFFPFSLFCVVIVVCLFVLAFPLCLLFSLVVGFVFLPYGYVMVDESFLVLFPVVCPCLLCPVPFPLLLFLFSVPFSLSLSLSFSSVLPQQSLIRDRERLLHQPLMGTIEPVVMGWLSSGIFC